MKKIVIICSLFLLNGFQVKATTTSSNYTVSMLVTNRLNLIKDQDVAFGQIKKSSGAGGTVTLNAAGTLSYTGSTIPMSSSGQIGQVSWQGATSTPSCSCTDCSRQLGLFRSGGGGLQEILVTFAPSFSVEDLGYGFGNVKIFGTLTINSRAELGSYSKSMSVTCSF